MVSGKSDARKGRPARPKQNRAQVGLPARRQALGLVAQVLGKSRSFSDPLDSTVTTKKDPGLTTRDMALARNIALTTLRHLGELNAVLERVYARGLPARSGELRAILLTASCQILFMDVANHAAVDLAVRLAKYDRHARHHAGLVNAGLRRIAKEGADLLSGADAPKLNTPDWLWQTWCQAWGEETARKIAAAHMIEPPLDITPARDRKLWQEKLGGQLLATGSIRLPNHGAIESLSGFKEGAWWVQDAAAALPVKLFGNVKGKVIADLCAAPGGKTMQLAAAGAQVIALDRSATRMERVSENLNRCALNADIVISDALEWVPERELDGILLDVPCTATGTIRRHPDIAWTKTPKARESLIPLQAKLLDRALALVKTGGTIVYCTCSLDPSESEEQINALLDRTGSLRRHPVTSQEIDGLEGAITELGDLRTFPFMSPPSITNSKEEWTPGGVDGFYAARLKKI